MADFSGQDITPIQAGESVKAGIQVQPTDTSTNQLYGVKAGVSALAGLADLGGKVVERFDKIKVGRVEQDLIESLSQNFEGVNQGVISPQESNTYYNATLNRIISSDPMNAEKYLDVANKVRSSAGFTSAYNSAVDREKAANERDITNLKEAEKLGQISPGAGLGADGKLNNEGRAAIINLGNVRAVDEDFRQLKQRSEALKDSQTIALNEQHLTGAKLSNTRARIENDRLRLQVDSENAMQRFLTSRLPIIQNMVETIINDNTAYPTAESKKTAIMKVEAQAQIDVSKLGSVHAGSVVSNVAANFKPFFDTAKGRVDGSIAEQIADNEFKYTKNKAALLAAGAHGGTVVLGLAAIGAGIQGPPSPKVVGAQESIVDRLLNLDSTSRRLLEVNTTKGGSYAYPYASSDGKDNPAEAYKLLSKNLTLRYQNEKELGPSQLKDLDESIGNTVFNTFRGISNTQDATPAQMSVVKDLLTNPNIHKVFDSHKDDPEWASVRKKAAEMFDRQYFDKVYDVLQRTMQLEGIELTPMGGYAGQDKVERAPNSRVLRITFEGNGVSASVNRDNLNQGYSLEEAQAQANKLNRPGGDIDKINDLLSMHAALNGGDKKTAWEVLVPKVQPPKEDPRSLNSFASGARSQPYSPVETPVDSRTPARRKADADAAIISGAKSVGGAIADASVAVWEGLSAIGDKFKNGQKLSTEEQARWDEGMARLRGDNGN